jgi:hypothetical protein
MLVIKRKKNRILRNKDRIHSQQDKIPWHTPNPQQLPGFFGWRMLKTAWLDAPLSYSQLPQKLSTILPLCLSSIPSRRVA